MISEEVWDLSMFRINFFYFSRSMKKIDKATIFFWFSLIMKKNIAGDRATIKS